MEESIFISVKTTHKQSRKPAARLPHRIFSCTKGVMKRDSARAHIQTQVHYIGPVSLSAYRCRIDSHQAGSARGEEAERVAHQHALPRSIAIPPAHTHQPVQTWRRDPVVLSWARPLCRCRLSPGRSPRGTETAARGAVFLAGGLPPRAADPF